MNRELSNEVIPEVSVLNDNVDQKVNDQEKNKNMFKKTASLFGNFSINLVQVIFFSIFAVVAFLFFLSVVLKKAFKKKK